jgi:putative glycerol-1-phosphate prenyltransferase
MIYSTINSNRGAFALLIDPDKQTGSLTKLVTKAQSIGVDLILVGGSLVKRGMDETIAAIKSSCNIPTVLFPGSVFQFCPAADAILLLSLISGRNAEYLIGNHVIASQAIKESKMEVIPTGYMLIDTGGTSSVQYMSNTIPIPQSKPDIALATALAGEQLGLKTIYLEGGSGAHTVISQSLISMVCTNVSIPVIVGGGIKTPTQVKNIRSAGASMVVVGNSIENDPGLLEELVAASR